MGGLSAMSHIVMIILKDLMFHIIHSIDPSYLMSGCEWCMHMSLCSQVRLLQINQPASATQNVSFLRMAMSFFKITLKPLMLQYK